MIARLRLDRGTLRAAGFVGLMTVVFLTVNTAVAVAADGNGDAAGGGLLAPLNIASSEGARLDGYQLGADGGPVLNVIGQFQVLVLGGLFALVRLLVGLCGWLVDLVFDFPLLRLLAAPAQDLADTYNTHVVDALGLEALLLGWAFIFGGIVFMRGKAGTGLGEIILTLVIAAFAASAFIRPDYLLGQDGPLNQAHEAAVEVAQITTRSYFGETGAGVCAAAVATVRDTCYRDNAQTTGVVRPIQDALTDALVVKPYMLLQYGTILDPTDPDDKAAYAAHLKWVKRTEPTARKPRDNTENPCAGLWGPAKDYCNREGGPPRTGITPSDPLDPFGLKQSTADPAFLKLLADLDKAGERGKAAAAYAQSPSWDRVGAVVLLLVAVLVIALLVVSMVLVMLGAQAGDAAAAAGGGVAWVWAMLPGPSRMVLWRWFGVFVVSVMVSFVTAMALPLFGITVDVIFSRSGPDLMVEKLIMVDAVAFAFLVFHRRMLASAAGFGQRMATRMRFAKIGGSHLRGDQSEFGAALAVHGPSGGGSGGRLGGGATTAAHSAFSDRLRSLGSLSALSDGTGMPFSPGRLIADGVAEGRRGLAPLAVAVRGAHSALIGPPPGRHPAAAALHRTANSTQPGPQGEMVVNGQTGEVLHDPGTDRPLLGSRIHARASRLRSYRAGAGTARVAYGATLGLPRTLWHARRSVSEFTQDAGTQLRVAARYAADDLGGWAPVARPVLRAGLAVGPVIRNGGRIVGEALWERPAAPSGTDENASRISHPRDSSGIHADVPSGPAVRPARRTDFPREDRSGGGPTPPGPAPMRRAGAGSTGEGNAGGRPGASTGSDREATSRPTVRPDPGRELPREDRPPSRRTPPPPPGLRPRQPEAGPADGPLPAESLLEEIRRRREQARESERRRLEGGSE